MAAKISGTGASWLAAVGAFGLAWCVTWLFLGTRTLMFALAASGRTTMAGPSWMWIVPVSILAGFGFGALNAWAAGRAGGMVIARYGWTALFWSLGSNFVEVGLATRGTGPGIPFVFVGVVFLALGAVPLPIGRADFEAGWPIPRITGTRLHIALSFAAVAVGVAVSVPAFYALTG